MSLKKKISTLALIATMGVSGIIGYNSMNPSKPNYTDDSKTNVNRQMEHIENISKEPHSIFDKEAKEEVRDYLISELKKLGLEPKTYMYEDVFVERTGTKEDIENIYVEIKGKSDSYIMLATHYDSSRAKTERYAEKDGSLGSADAGYALSTILETLRVIKESDIELENGIKILLTDGEEYGLLGAKEAVKDKEIFKGVNYLVNIEARGTKGPAIMFETSPNNAPVMDLYESSEKPFSYSITPEIYRLLPNGTDFTVFLENNLTGINISVLDGLENYHTPNDNPDNLSDESMQHYGDQVLPIVKEFVSNEKYANPENLKGEDDSIFFTLGNIFVKYSKTVNLVMLVLISLGIFLLSRRFEIKKSNKIFKYIAMNTAFTTLAMGAGYGISRLMAVLNGRAFKITYLPLMKFEGLILVSTIIALFVGYVFMVKRFVSSHEDKSDYTIASLLSLLILSVIFTIVLPGASYLTVFPVILIVASLMIKNVFSSIKNIGYIMFVPIALVTLLFVPTLYLFNCALTIGALCANVFFAMIAVTAIVVSILNMKELFN